MNSEIMLLVVIFVFVFLILLRGGGRDYSARLRGIDRKLDLVLGNLGIDPDQGVDKQVAELARSGQKIEAIKLYRAQTGVGLKEAKDYVEGL
jgi:hypothetical protein